MSHDQRSDAPSKELFTRDDVIGALQNWLEFGESSVGQAHGGYFSGGGWAARVLRSHLDALQSETAKQDSSARAVAEKCAEICEHIGKEIVCPEECAVAIRAYAATLPPYGGEEK